MAIGIITHLAVKVVFTMFLVKGYILKLNIFISMMGNLIRGKRMGKVLISTLMGLIMKVSGVTI